MAIVPAFPAMKCAGTTYLLAHTRLPPSPLHTSEKRKAIVLLFNLLQMVVSHHTRPQALPWQHVY